ncbi:MAG: LysR family transcriptional regulator [Bacillota bacterium]
MEHKNLNSFKMVAECGSFSKAAKELGYAQSTVTFQIKQLEEELGALLFDRIGNHISLTGAGITLLDYSCRILSLENEVKSIIIEDDAPAGTIRIASIDSLCANLLPSLIKEFSETYPAVTISASSVSKAEVLKSITNGSADFGFYIDFDASTDEYNTVLSARNSLCFVCSPNHKVYQKEPLNIRELKGVPMIVTEKNCTYRKFLQQIFGQSDVELKVYFESENTEVIKHFAEAGIGVAFLPEIVVKEELHEQKLCHLSVDVEIPLTYINVVCHKNKWLNPAMREFCKVLKQVY